MKARSRNILFGIVLLVFFISSPLLVLYALGYRYDSTEGRLHKTATIALTFQPGEAEVFIDENSAGQKNEKVLLQGLKTGSHVVRLEKAHYQTWTHTFSATAGTVSFADDIILMKSDLAPETVLPFAITSSLSSRENDRLFLTSSLDDDTQLTVIDQTEFRTLQQSTVKKLKETLGSDVDISLDKATWLTGGTWIVFPYTKNSESFLFGWNTQSNAIYDLAVFSKNADDFVATPQTDVLAIDEDGLTAWMNLSTGETTSPQKTLFRLARTLRSISIEKDSSVCALKEKTTPLSDSRVVSEISCGAYEGEEFEGKVALRNRITGELFVYDFSSRQLQAIAKKSTRFSWAQEAETPTLFYSQGNELWLYRANETSPRFLTRTSSSIDSFQPHASGNYVFWENGGTLAMAEVIFPDAIHTASWQLTGTLISIAQDADNSKLLLLMEDAKKQRHIMEVSIY